MATPAQPLASLLRFDNIAIAVGDLTMMTAWYEGALGFVVGERGTFEAVGASYAMLDGAGVRIELVSRAASRVTVDRTAPPEHHLDVLGLKAIVLRTDDLIAVTAGLREQDVELVWADMELSPGLRSTMIRDPEGNLINIFGPRSED